MHVEKRAERRLYALDFNEIVTVNIGHTVGVGKHRGVARDGIIRAFVERHDAIGLLERDSQRVDRRGGRRPHLGVQHFDGAVIRRDQRRPAKIIARHELARHHFVMGIATTLAVMPERLEAGFFIGAPSDAILPPLFRTMGWSWAHCRLAVGWRGSFRFRRGRQQREGTICGRRHRVGRCRCRTG